MRTYLDFEKPIAELESKVAELKALAAEQRSVSIEEELAKLEAKAREALEETYSELTPWQKTQVARHPERPALPPLHRRARAGFHAARRRPLLRRGPGDHRRHRPPQGDARP